MHINYAFHLHIYVHTYVNAYMHVQTCHNVNSVEVGYLSEFSFSYILSILYRIFSTNHYKN